MATGGGVTLSHINFHAMIKYHICNVPNTHVLNMAIKGICNSVSQRNQ